MQFRVLGPLEVVEDGRSLVLGGPKQRAVLALLVLEANRPLSKDWLIDAIWGAQPPVSASHTLDSYISRLRRLLGPDRLVRRPAGYELRVDAGELDLSTFADLVAKAEQVLPQDPAAAAVIFRKALALSKGDPLGTCATNFPPPAYPTGLWSGTWRRWNDRLKRTWLPGRAANLSPSWSA
jgi:hypothetical protein